MAPARETSGVIAQLTGGHNRQRQSMAPSPQFPAFHDANQSTVDSFQPEHESTQQFDTAADLQDAASRGSFSTDHDSDEPSIEVGRGVKRSTKITSGGHAYANDFSEDRLLDLGDDSLYNLTSTPPPACLSHAYKSNDLRKQASVRRAVREREAEVTKTSDIVPTKTRNTKSAARRTLSDMHAKINAISGSSFILPEPQSHNFATRNTRFSKPRVTSTTIEVPTRFTAGTGLGRATGHTPRRVVSAPDSSLVANHTAQSFILPDLPNIAELVSGTRKDGTPVFTRRAESRSRFASASYARGANPESTAYLPVRSIPLPEEEKAIFTSLQLLKEKVAQLEQEKSDNAKRAEEFENEIIALKSQVQMERRLRRPDSGLGSDEDQHNSEQWRRERGQLQASLKIAQDRLERSDRKHSSADGAVKKITQERDSLITQLGVAFYSNEELKEDVMQLQTTVEDLENQFVAFEEEILQLREANQELQIQLERSEKQHDGDLRQWALREVELKARVKRSSQAHKAEGKLAKSVERDEPPKRAIKPNRQDAQGRILERVEQEVRRARAAAVQQSKVAVKPARGHSASRSRSRPREVSSLQGAQTRERSLNTHRDRWLEEQVVAKSHGRQLDMDVAPDSLGSEEDSKDITYLSFLDPAELSALRMKLETERLASKQRHNSAPPANGTKPGSQSLPRKSALTTDKATNGRMANNINRAVRVQSPATADAISYTTPEDGAEASMLSNISRRPQRSQSFEEMTSAFLLPDITMHKDAAVGATGGVSAAVKKPVPVTEREIDGSFATQRPAQDPNEALAWVVEQLQEEIKQSKRDLGQTEREYEGCDPAIGKRKRVGLKTRMEELVAQIERRSEQVYALYDVLEGQDRNGRELDETLQDLGIDLAEMRKRAVSGNGARTGGPIADDAESVDIGDVSAPTC